MSLFKSLLRKKESWFKYTMGVSHLWLGLLSSIVVFVVCLTGSIYAYKNQIIDFYNRDKVYVKIPSNQPRIPMDTLWKQFAEKKQEISMAIIPENPSKSLVISYTDLQTSISKTQYFNPYTGQELGVANRNLDSFFQVVLNIHRTLLITKIGKQIVGISILIFVFMLLSGLILWWPKKIKELKNGLSIKWKAKFHRINYDLHNTLGFYTFLLLLFIALTGLYVTYPWVKSGMIVALGGKPVLSANASAEAQSEISSSFAEMLQQMVEKEGELKAMKDVQALSLDSILQLTYQHLPYQATTVINLPDKEDPRYRVKKINRENWLGAFLPDLVTFDKKGTLKTIERFKDKPLHKQFVEISLPLHTGEIMGWPSITLYFLVSLVGCSLPVTGFIIWWKKVK
jgi:uncharacterized iron-regulated membrane protein